MAQESCNLDKEEAEILKPSLSSSPPTPQSSLQSQAPLFMNSLHELPAKKSKKRKRPAEEEEEGKKPPVRLGNRCSSCRKKVGLIGFRCRCGGLFCGRHRHCETHDCSFDYKAFGREQISKANPVVRAAKIIKI